MSKEEENNTKPSAGETAPVQPGEASQAESAQAAAAETATLSVEELGALLKKLDEAAAETNLQKERYLRTVADLENYRKRALREKEEARKQANCSLLEDLLPVIDNFRLGLKSAEQHEGGTVFADGFRMILSQMEAALKQNGLEEINPGNELFDPNYHESVAHIPHESVEADHIIEVHRIGYRIHERLLRPAAVVVSSGPVGAAQEAGQDA